MPRINYVRYTVQKANSDNVENFRSEEGTTYAEILTDDLGVNTSKFTLYVNGTKANLDDEVCEGDELKLEPKNYDSGC